MQAETMHRWQLLSLALLSGFLIWLLAPVLMPFALAALLAYLGDPAVRRLKRLGLSRVWAASIVFIALLLMVIGVIVVLLPLLAHQVESFLISLPRYIEWLQARLHLDPAMFDTQQLWRELKANIDSIGGMATRLLSQVSRSSLGAVLWLSNLVLVPVVAFYLLRDWELLIGLVGRMLPRSVEPAARQLARDSDDVLSAFIRGQLLVMLVLGLYYGLGLSLVVGLSAGTLIGMLAGLLSFVPYLGFIAGALAALIATMVQYGDWTHLLLMVAVFAVGQVLEGYVLVPKLVGDKIGLHPVAVMFAVLAGGYLGGFLGVLLALPAASVLMVFLRHLLERYRRSDLYNAGAPVASSESAVPPSSPLDPT